MSEQPISNEAADYDGDTSSPSYGALVRAWGFEVIYWRTLGSYQGDFVVGLRDGRRVGIVVIGYGSCSGCDALEGAFDYTYDESGYSCRDWLSQQRVIDLSEELRADVKWFDDTTQLRMAVHAWATGTSPDVQWWMHDKEYVLALHEAVTALGGT